MALYESTNSTPYFIDTENPDLIGQWQMPILNLLEFHAQDEER
jgi:hypothetical protein